MLVAFVGLFAVWIALARRFEPAVFLAGAIAAAGVALLQRYLFPQVNLSLRALTRRPHQVFLFIALLLWRFVASTVYTSCVILFSREEGRIVAIPTKVSDPFGRFLLLNAITLTPSTISLLLEGDLLYIHWLRREGGGGDWRKVKEPLENRLNAIFAGRDDENR